MSSGSGSTRSPLGSPKRLSALILALPLLAFTVVSFVVPLAQVFLKSVHEPETADALSLSLRTLEDWDGTALPTEETFAAMAKDLLAARENRNIGKVATRVNRVHSGARSVLVKTGSRLRRVDHTTADWRAEMLKIDDEWSEIAFWIAIRDAGSRFTARNYLQALDLQKSAGGWIERVDESRQIYVTLFLRTLGVSLVVTVVCLLVGYPIAYTIANASTRWMGVLLLLVLVPFWTSLLVRTTSWIVLLQQQGVVNDVLVTAGLVGDANRLQLIYNMTGTVVAMTHVLLPFMVLPIYAVMRGIPSSYVNAAVSLGATPTRAFFRVYWPQSMPGVTAGAILVFILTIGFYITPAIVGGTSGQLISNMIAFHIQTSLNWGLGAAISAILMVSVLVLYALFDRLVGIDRLKLA